MVRLVTLAPVTIADSDLKYPLSESSVFSNSITIESPSSNAGTVSVGGSDLDATNGTSLVPGSTAVIELPGDDSRNQFDLAEMFVKSTVDGDVVKVSYVKRL